MPTAYVTTREQYLALFQSASEAIEFEHTVLSAGREFLPAPAILVLEGVAPGPDYWTFLAEQIEKSNGSS